MIVVYILLFLVCLSTLVMIHELGHLVTAKIFKVYCFEYAIGFGPKLFSLKRKKGETAFSLRAIPFGGFVSMYGEAETVPEGMTIPEERSLNNIKKWKRAIIMVAGVIMNFVLAIVIFFIYEIGFPKYIGRYGHINVANGSSAYEAGLRSKDGVYAILSNTDRSLVYYDNNAEMIYEGASVECYFGYDYSSLSIKNTSLYDHTIAWTKLTVGQIDEAPSSLPITITQILDNDYEDDVDYLTSGYVQAMGIIKVKEGTADKDLFVIQVVENYGDPAANSVFFSFDNYADNKNDFKYLPIGERIEVVGKIKSFESGEKLLTAVSQNYEFNVPDYDNGKNLFESKIGTLEPVSLQYSMIKLDDNGRFAEKFDFLEEVSSSGGKYKLKNNPGISMELDEYRSNYGEAVTNTFVDFGESATLIGQGLARLFTDASSWQDVGGIIAIGVVTTQTLQENGFGQFLFYWALISVNLGIVNLLPFPGLDGWHFLVTIIEGVSRKELPVKFKTIMSAIGIGLLFILMILIVIKDIIRFI